MDSEHPELAGYEPIEGRPLRGERYKKVLRAVVILAIVALIVPGVLVTISVAAQTAAHTCAVYVARYQPRAAGSSARFELFAPRGAGWQCYWLDAGEHATYLAPLGIIPAAPAMPQRKPTLDS